MPALDPEIEAAALVAAAGIDLIGYLHADELEQAVILAAAARVHEIHQLDRHNLAVEIRNEIGELFGG